MRTFPTWREKNKIHVWKHQPEGDVFSMFLQSPVLLVQIPQSTIPSWFFRKQHVVAFHLLCMVQLANMWGMEHQPPLVTSVWLLISNIHTLPMGYVHAVAWHYICVEYMSKRMRWWVEHAGFMQRGDLLTIHDSGETTTTRIYENVTSAKETWIVMFSGCNQSQNTRCKHNKNG